LTVFFALLEFVYLKAVLKMLVKLTLGVNSINVLWAAFTRTDPKSAKKTVKLWIFFVLLGSAHAKAAWRMLMKLNPGRISKNRGGRYRSREHKWAPKPPAWEPPRWEPPRWEHKQPPKPKWWKKYIY